MFVFISHPWPVAAAYPEFADPMPARVAACRADAMAELGASRVPQVEDLVRWTGPERIRLRWYRLRLAVGDRSHAYRGIGLPPPGMP